MNSTLRDTLVAQFLTNWRSQKRDTVSISIGDFKEFFPFLQPVHTIHDKESGDIQYLVFSREYVIKQVKSHYNMEAPNGT